MSDAETILRAGNLIDFGPAGSRPEPLGTHLVIADGRIVAVGGAELERAYPDAEVIDFGGDAAILPGLIDCHTHPVWGSESQGGSLGLGGVTSLAQLRERLEAAHAAADPDAWITGYDLDVNAFEGAEPNGRVFEEWLPGRRVSLMTRDAHALVVSPAVVAGIGLTGDEVFADASSIVADAGGPTGWVLELQAMDLVLAHLPQAPLAVQADYLADALRRFAETGLTEVHALDFHEPSRELYEELERRGELPVRVRIYPLVPADSTPEVWAGIAALQGVGGRRWRVDGAKFMLDGTADNGTAWFAEPDRLGENHEALWRSTDAYREAVRFFTERGVPTATHAIGDAAVDFVLDVVAEVGHAPSAPHRVEHIESIPDATVVRFAELGVVASIQPTHATRLTEADGSDNWSRRIGPDRVAHGWRIRDLIAQGAPVVLGSDWPIGIGDPRVSLADAQLRRPVGEPDRGEHQPEQKIDAAAAYRSMTSVPAGLFAGAGDVAGAGAAAGDAPRGRFEPGSVADLTVLAADPMGLPPEAQAVNPVLATFVDGGRVVGA
ncbi:MULTISPECIES: amidohydrolase [unclassified Leucobacter]|uniref:amidohydrolase n=1 Tax=unclassified Leucobacter TaxID=2621730 RepID=UPI000B115F8A|nr:amidohydrolase family protein [Leucobacter sp. Ag1]